MYEIPAKWFNQLPQAIKQWIESIYNGEKINFDATALTLFEWQRRYNPIYKAYLDFLKYKGSPQQPSEIPGLPIQFFKKYTIKSGDFHSNLIFQSSGTTMAQRSKHYIISGSWYKQISEQIFLQAFGDIHGAVILGLLPHYIENGDSSLIYMVSHFIDCSKNELSGFYLNQYATLEDKITTALNTPQTVYLFGIPYALMDFISHTGYKNWDNINIIETGGMKGRRTELPKSEFHALLQSTYHTKNIFSEYGMTELMSQFYTQSRQTFSYSPTAKIIVKEVNDPFSVCPVKQTGRINIIDLANFFSCAFIETDDLGMMLDQTHFELSGRLDNSDLRGCNLLMDALE